MVWNQLWGFYLNPEFINEKSIIYSFGIGEDISFDLSLIKEFDCNVFGFDFTPKSIGMDFKKIGLIQILNFMILE